ncbi:uncharacterized protein LOC128959694 [Oppia nitens]|uniref:uncharacterized protein LOC128959694 n=1 Tax=Oppia nitens TaxID=1686743 RepID=UPI0023DC63D8|nr:uncharacterized protein LOC128959694 [Oppia nitens]
MFKLNHYYISLAKIIIVIIILVLIQHIHSISSDQECGGQYVDDHGDIVTPFSPVGTYPANWVCKWSINVKQGYRIKLSINKLDSHPNDRLTVYDGVWASDPVLGVFSGGDGHHHQQQQHEPFNLISHTNSLLLVLTSGPTSLGTGFNITYDAINYDFSTIINSPNGSAIISPINPDNFYNVTYYWTINMPDYVSDSQVIIIFIFNYYFKLIGQQCKLSIYQMDSNNNNNKSTLIVDFEDTDQLPSPKLIQATTNKLLVKYESNIQCDNNYFYISLKTKMMGSRSRYFISATNTIITIDDNQTIEDISYYSMDSYSIIEYLIERKINLNVKPYNMVYDWIHGLLYWIDIQFPAINVMTVTDDGHTADGGDNNVYTIIELNTEMARDLRLNRLKLTLIWSQIGAGISGLVQCHLDGTNQSTVYRSSRQVFHLTIDYQWERYYFIDITDHSLLSIDFNGADEKLYMTSRFLLQSIHNMFVLNGDLYLANERLIYRIPELELGIDRAEILFYTTSAPEMSRKYSESHFYYNKPIDINRQRIYDFKIADPILEPTVRNRCIGHKCPARHLCVPVSTVKHGYRCLSSRDSSQPALAVSQETDNQCKRVDILSVVNTFVIAVITVLIVGLYLSIKKIVFNIEKRLFQVIIPTETFRRSHQQAIHNYENNQTVPLHDYETIDQVKHQAISDI